MTNEKSRDILLFLAGLILGVVLAYVVQKITSKGIIEIVRDEKGRIIQIYEL